MAQSLTLEKIKQIIDKAAPGAVLKAEAAGAQDDCLFIDKRQIKRVCETLKTDGSLAFDMLIDETCLDMIAHPDWEVENDEERFQLVYILYSITNNRCVKLKAKVRETDCSIDSVAPVWRAADWLEREIAEMFGVKFAGHPNPKPLFLWEGFVGYPLRKDYPLKGQQPIVELARPIPIKDEPGHMTPQFEKDYFMPLPTREINAADRLPTSMLRPTWKEELKAKRLAAKCKNDAEKG